MNEQPTQSRARAKAVLEKCRSDFEYYAPLCLKITTKPDEHGSTAVVPFRLNQAQRYIHKKIEEQRAKFGWVRAIILKGRQQGASTYVEGRFYWKTTMNQGQQTYILTHQIPATNNLFAMVARYHKHAPPFVKPQVNKSNAQELSFGQIDSKYQVATAGSKGAGRSATLTNVHGSEVGFWENGEEHLKGMMQAVPLAPGTEVVFESTANGLQNVFAAQWKLAEAGMSDFVAIFVPWYWQAEYRRKVPDDFQVSDDHEIVPDGEPTELEIQKTFKIDDEQIYWRRMKIIELGGGEQGLFAFKQEYPFTSDEAFQSSGLNSLLSRQSVLKARKSDVATEGDLIIGVDPAGDGQDSDGTGIIRRRTRRMFDPQLIKGLTVPQLAAMIWRIIKNEKPKRVFIDIGGIGKGIFDCLMEMTGTRGIVIPVNFGEAALNPDIYVNRRVEMAYALKDWIEDIGGANIPDDDAVQADFLASVPDDPDRNQRKRLKSKKWMRSEGIPSPNFFDAGCLTLALPVAMGDTDIGNSQVNYDPVGETNPHGLTQIGSAFHDFEV